MGITLKKLDPAELEGQVNTFKYESSGHYRVRVTEREGGWSIDLKREDFRETFTKEEPETIVTPYKGRSEIHGAFDGETRVGFIQFEFQEWNRSLRVWDIDIDEGHRRKGIGRMLMELAVSRARELRARRVILETQTSNLKAIEFYRAMGFTLAGLDTSNYHNDDITRKEVRLEMALCLEE